jgi:hypothetical protein
MWDYLGNIGPAFLAFFSLLKDWELHKRAWHRWTVLGLIMLMGIAGGINTYRTNKRAEEQRNEDQNRIAALTQGIETANKNQTDNTKLFVEDMDRLRQQLSNLQVQVKTSGLRKEAARLNAELEATRKALIGPKATLTFTFARPQIDAPPIKTVTLPVRDDVVHVEFTMVNYTDTTALNGEINLIICNVCEFASEPQSFRRLPGQPSTQRNYPFARILAKSELSTMSADIKVPPHLSSVEFGVNYRCTNCVVPEPRANMGTILLSR